MKFYSETYLSCSFLKLSPLEKDFLSIPHSGSRKCVLVSVVIVWVIVVKNIAIVWKVEKSKNIVTCRMVRVTKWRVLVLLIGFISTSVTHSLLITLKYRQYSSIADIHNLHFTAAHALGFPVFTSRLLATELNTNYNNLTGLHTPRITVNRVFKSLCTPLS
jgi:hypothetical protein